MPQARDADGNFIPLVTIRDRDLRMLRFIAMDPHPPAEWEELALRSGYEEGVLRVQFHRFQKVGLIDPDGGITPIGLQAIVLLG